MNELSWFNSVPYSSSISNIFQADILLIKHLSINLVIYSCLVSIWPSLGFDPSIILSSLSLPLSLSPFFSYSFSIDHSSQFVNRSSSSHVKFKKKKKPSHYLTLSPTSAAIPSFSSLHYIYLHFLFLPASPQIASFCSHSASATVIMVINGLRKTKPTLILLDLAVPFYFVHFS